MNKNEVLILAIAKLKTGSDDAIEYAINALSMSINSASNEILSESIAQTTRQEIEIKEMRGYINILKSKINTLQKTENKNNINQCIIKTDSASLKSSLIFIDMFGISRQRVSERLKALEKQGKIKAKRLVGVSKSTTTLFSYPYWELDDDDFSICINHFKALGHTINNPA